MPMTSALPTQIRWRLRAVAEKSGAIKLFFLPQRARMALRVVGPQIGSALAWLVHSNELANFTYPITSRCERHIAYAIAVALGADAQMIFALMQEPKTDMQLRDCVAGAIANSRYRSVVDRQIEFGRRLGWYAVVRHTKPAIVVETGVDKGMGAVLLCAALRRNAGEGMPGRYYGTDIESRAGFLLQPPYKQYGEILYGDSIESLAQLNEDVDIFINDSDHSPDYEYREYRAIAGKLKPNAVLLSDNAHATDSLIRFSKETRRAFLFVREEPAGHWYPGAGIGLSFTRHLAGH